MNYSAHSLAPSSINLPTVYDIDVLKAEAKKLEIQPTRPNLRRIRRAFDLLEKGNALLVGLINKEARFYVIKSQSRKDRTHLAVANGIVQCTCEDARKFARRRKQSECKHAIAIRIQEANQEAETN